MSDTTENPGTEAAPARKKGFTRRRAITTSAAVATVGAAAVAGVVDVVRFINPRPRFRKREAFVAFVHEVPEEGTLDVELPDGRRVGVKRVGSKYAAFSNVCPHLSCRVTWTKAKDGETDPKKKAGYFRCPCHEGYFGPDGEPFAGPPADAGQSLERVPLLVRGSTLYVQYEEELT